MNDWILIQPTAAHEDLEAIRQGIAAQYKGTFILVGVAVEDWNRELSPWEAPALFGGSDFGSGAAATLQRVLERVDGVRTDAGSRVCIGGYSMAGLFALYAVMQHEGFDAVCAVSPSVWFPGWMDYAAGHPVHARRAYISLGDREHRSRNELVRRVHDCVQRQYDLFPCTRHLDWNEGTHFTDPVGRMVRGYLWVMSGE